MSEYIVNVGDADELHFAAFQKRAEFCFGYPVREEIVRCHDCKHYQDHNFGSKLDWCRYFHYDVHLDGFCKWGVRREGADNG